MTMGGLIKTGLGQGTIEDSEEMIFTGRIWVIRLSEKGAGLI